MRYPRPVSARPGLSQARLVGWVFPRRRAEAWVTASRVSGSAFSGSPVFGGGGVPGCAQPHCRLWI